MTECRRLRPGLVTRGLLVALGFGFSCSGALAAPGEKSSPVTTARPNQNEATNNATVEPAGIAVRDLAGSLVRPLANQGQKATVLFFVMHECPVANGYAPEISRIANEYGKRGVRSYVVYIEDDLTPEKARTHAKEYGYRFGALLDPAHRLAKLAGATISPEAAILSPKGEILYRGRIDDRVADFGKHRVQPTRRDLRLSLDAVLAGKPVPNRFTRAVGCYLPDEPASTSSKIEPPGVRPASPPNASPSPAVVSPIPTSAPSRATSLESVAPVERQRSSQRPKS